MEDRSRAFTGSEHRELMNNDCDGEPVSNADIANIAFFLIRLAATSSLMTEPPFKVEAMEPYMGLTARVVAGVSAALVALGLVSVIVVGWNDLSSKIELRPTAGIGGPFSLVDHHGKLVTERDYLGKPALVFFGFTFCPDICPTTLLELTELLKKLGAEADRLNVLFITVDPERDTPPQLALYLSSFDPHIVGLSGTTSEIESVMAKYKVYAQKVPLKDGGYTMDHTAVVYMMNQKGQFVGLMNYEEPQETARAKLRKLLDDAAKNWQ